MRKENGLQPDQLIKYLLHLQSRNTNSIGYLPKPALQAYHDRGEILVAEENSEPAGYLLFRSPRNYKRATENTVSLKIIQACIQFDARRIKHATQLVHNAEILARRHGLTTITLWCGSDLAANAFWIDIGFKHTGTRLGGEGRRRIHNHYTRVIKLPVK